MNTFYQSKELDKIVNMSWNHLMEQGRKAKLNNFYGKDHHNQNTGTNAKERSN